MRERGGAPWRQVAASRFHGERKPPSASIHGTPQKPIMPRAPGSRPASVLMTVDLPEPDGPESATSSPRASAKAARTRNPPPELPRETSTSAISPSSPSMSVLMRRFPSALLRRASLSKPPRVS